MSSGYEKTAKEHMVLTGLEDYIEDTIEYSDTILSIHNDIQEVKDIAEDNHRYAMDHINDEYSRLESELDSKVYDLESMIDDLKQMIEDLKK